MATATSTFSWTNDTVANEKIWCNGVKNLLTTVGLVQTTDTGQLDIDAISAVPSGATTIGYQVFKFPDALQATAPIFIKIIYGSDSASRPKITLEVGYVTNGAGTISTPSFVTTAPSSMGTFQAGLTSYACYVDGTFSMCLGYMFLAAGVSNNSVASLVVDRARDATGTALGTGFLCESSLQPLSTQSQSRSIYGAASPASSVFIPSLIPSTTATGSSDGANVNVFRHYMMVPGVKPSLGCLTYFNAEFGALTPFSATVLGSTHTYRPMGNAMNYWSAVSNVNHCASIRWE